MDLTFLWMILGFMLAAYSVVANDSVQTLGPWLASNLEKFKWYTLWGPASAGLLITSCSQVQVSPKFGYCKALEEDCVVLQLKILF